MLRKSIDWLAFLVLLLCTAAPSLSQYPICDGKEANQDLEMKIDRHVARLMELRKPDWGWANSPGVVLGLQLSKQRSFFERNVTLETMRKQLLNEVNVTNVGKLALYAMALQSVCENPRRFSGINLIKKIRHSLRTQWNYNGKRSHEAPKDGWYKYGLALQALCVSGRQVTKYHLNRVIRKQNEDGSYGSKSSVDNTAQVLLAWGCVRGQATRYFRKRATQAIDKAVSFLRAQVTRERDSLWIGNKYSTPGALLALDAVHGHNQSDLWSCTEATSSITSGLVNDEPEGAIAQRLPAVRGHSVLSLQNDWKCLEQTVSTPQGYVPNYNPNQNLDCSNFLPDQFVIDVRLSVLKTIGAQLSDPYDKSVLVDGVKDGNTLLQVMAQARCQNDFQFETVSSSFGPYVTSVDGLASNSTLRQYWSLVNAETGGSLQVGVGQYRPVNNQHILFQLKTY